MKKKLGLSNLLGAIALVATLAGFLLPLGTGIVRHIEGVTDEYVRAYDFVFGNWAYQLYSTAAFIAAFSLLVIGAFFLVLGVVFVYFGSNKFGGFLDFLGGLCIVPTGIIYIMAESFSVLPGGENVTFSLGYGFVGAAIACFVAGILGIVAGIISMRKKAN